MSRKAEGAARKTRIVPALGERQRPRLDGERQAVDLRDMQRGAEPPYSFSIVHCSGC